MRYKNIFFQKKTKTNEMSSGSRLHVWACRNILNFRIQCVLCNVPHRCVTFHCRVQAKIYSPVILWMHFVVTSKKCKVVSLWAHRVQLFILTMIIIILYQMVKVIWHKATLPPHTDGSVVFVRWRQCVSPGRYNTCCWGLHPKWHLGRFIRFGKNIDSSADIIDAARC